MNLLLPLYRQFLNDEVPASALPEPKWGPIGKEVYSDNYSREIYMLDGETPHPSWVWKTPKDWGEDGRMNEVWAETCRRVIYGNLGFISPEFRIEDEDLKVFDLMYNLKFMPAGRHIWTTGATNFTRNCFRAGYGKNIRDHFDFLAMRLFEGGGVGANYSDDYLNGVAPVVQKVSLSVMCDESHPDFSILSPLLHNGHSREAVKAGQIYIKVEDSREGWVAAMSKVFDIGQGLVGYNPNFMTVVVDVSDVRAYGKPLISSGGTASGPKPLVQLLLTIEEKMNQAANEKRPLNWEETMSIDNAVGMAVVAGGARRSARMSIKLWSDPNIHDFITMKTPVARFYERYQTALVDETDPLHVVAGKIALLIPDNYEKLSDEERYDTVLSKAISNRNHPNHQETLDAENLLFWKDVPHWTTNISVELNDEFVAAANPEHPMHEHRNSVLDAIVHGMFNNGEPGMVNTSVVGKDEGVDLRSSNPCGEIFLEADSPGESSLNGAGESCNIGSVNLAGFLEQDSDPTEAFRLMSRFLVRATFSTINNMNQASIEARNRRIGVGFMGFQEWVCAHGSKWSEYPERQDLRNDVAMWRKEIRRAANELCDQVGVPRPVKVTAIAPTGTISLLTGSTSGIHPVMAKYYIRRKQYANSSKQLPAMVKQYRSEPSVYAANTTVVEMPVRDSILDSVDESLVEEMKALTVNQQYKVVHAVQEDFCSPNDGNAISYTAHMYLDDKDTLRNALEVWSEFLKGSTVMPPRSYKQEPIQTITQAEYEMRLFESGGVVNTSQGDMSCFNGACSIK